MWTMGVSFNKVYINCFIEIHFKILYDFDVEKVDAYVNESKGNDSLENNDERGRRVGKEAN